MEKSLTIAREHIEEGGVCIYRKGANGSIEYSLPIDVALNKLDSDYGWDFVPGAYELFWEGPDNNPVLVFFEFDFDSLNI